MSAYTQTSMIKGVIKTADDSTSVAYASIIISELKKNTTSNQAGKFSIYGVPQGKHKVMISSLGYEPYVIEIDVDSSVVDLRNIFIASQDYALDEFVIEAEAPMLSQKGDTTIYNASSFVMRPDDNADDLLAKMPGVISDGGNIKIQGKSVKKVYLDKKEFLGDVNSSLKNIPAEAIANIQVYEESSDQAAFAGIKDRDAQQVININTKNPKSNKTLYRAHAGGGASIEEDSQTLYKTGGNYMFIKPKSRIILMGGINNLNSHMVDQGDNLDDSRLMIMMGGGASSINPGKIISVGTNLSQEFKNFTTTGSYTYSNNRIESISERETTYFPVNGQFDSKVEEDNVSNINRINRHNGSFSLRSIPKLKKHIYDFRLSVNSNGNNSQSNQRQSATMNENPVSRNINLTQTNTFIYSIGAGGMWGYKISDERTIRFTTQFYINNSDSNSDPIQSNLEYYDLLTSTWSTSTNNTSDRFRDNTNKATRYSVSIYYTEPLSKSSKLSVHASVNQNRSQRLNEVYSYDPLTQEYAIIDIALSNDYKDVRNNQSLSLTYDYRKNDGKISFAVGSDFARENQNTDYSIPEEREYKINNFILKPNFRFDYTLSKTARMSIKYSGQTTTPNIKDLAKEIDNTSPTNIRIGNPDLKKGFNNHIELSFNDSKTDKKNRTSTYNLGINFNIASNITAYQIETMPIDRDTILYFYPESTEGYIPQRGARVSRPISLSGNYSIGINGSYGLNIPKLKSNFNLSANYRFSHYPMMYEEELNNANTNMVSGYLSASSKLARDLDINLRYNISYTNVVNSLKDKNDNSYISQGLNISVYYKFWKDIIITPSFSLSNNKNLSGSDYSQTYTTLNFSLGKKFLRSKNATVTLTGYNLLNQQKNMERFINEDRINDYKQNTFGRYILLTLSYNFNSMRLSKK